MKDVRNYQHIQLIANGIVFAETSVAYEKEFAGVDWIETQMARTRDFADYFLIGRHGEIDGNDGTTIAYVPVMLYNKTKREKQAV